MKGDTSAADIFSGTGRIAQSVWPDYEFREGQGKMSAAIDQALQSESILLLEAGTGIGKTIAYLHPLLNFAEKNRVRVAVSTETRALQQQIMEKDLPLLRKISGRNLRAEICYGSSNYLCSRKIEYIERTGDVDVGMGDSLDAFIAWANETDQGVRFEYQGTVRNDFWPSVVRDPESCPGRSCPQYERCHYFAAREKWKQSRLLVVNHSLLASHLALDRKLLPEFSHLIIDEAHGFPEIFAASMQGTFRFSEVAAIIADRGGRSSDSYTLLAELHSELDRTLNPGSGKNLRLFKALRGSATQLRDSLEEFSRSMQKENLKLEEEEHYLFDEETMSTAAAQDVQKMKLRSQLERLQSNLRTLNELSEQPQAGRVHWIFRRGTSQRFVFELHSAPVFSGNRLREELLERFKSVIFTSATLTTSGPDPFSFFKKEIGLKTEDSGSAVTIRDNGSADGEEGSLDPSLTVERMMELVIDSPFDYGRQALLYLPADLPDPAGREVEYHQAVGRELVRLLNLAGGGSFVLFTSIRSLEAVRKILKRDKDLDPGLKIFSQTDQGAARALQQFLKTPHSVLLGLATFRQGIDIPGEKLRMVVLVRLPFRVPDEPLLEARMEYEKKQGYNPFFSLQLPAAVLSLRQGFGRLIRSISDRGAVTILDPRIHTRSYGKEIVSNLPRAEIVRDFAELRLKFGSLFGSD